MRAKSVVLAAVLLASVPAAERAVASPVVLAQPKKAKANANPNAGLVKVKVALSPKALEWGLGLTAISKIYEKVLEREFARLYRKAEPGVATQALDAELADKKGLLQRNIVKFENIPTGMDSTPLKGEYTYNNGESVTWLRLGTGRTRYFFFFDDKLWKVYDEHPLKKGGNLGESFEDAAKKVSEAFKTAGKLVEPDYETQIFREVRWHTPDMYIRLVDRNNVIALVYERRAVADDLSLYRKNKPEDAHELNRDVKGALRNAPQKEPAPKQKGKK